MEAIVEKHKDKPQEDQPTVHFDFEYLFPVSLISWRGSYAELSLTFASGETKERPMKASVFLELLREAVGKTYEGYKGGDFTMSKHTPVWVSNYGHSANTAVIEIVDDDYQVMLITGYREF